MAFCLTELHLWSTKGSLKVKESIQRQSKLIEYDSTDTDIGTYQYSDKGEPARGYLWTPKNRRPEKLRDSLKDLEELMHTNTCVRARWRKKHCCQVILSSGVMVTLTLSGPQLKQVCVDRTLVGRLPANTIADAVLSDSLILLSFLDQRQVAAVYLNKINQDSPETGRRTHKFSSYEIKMVCVDVSEQGRRLRTHVGLNNLQDVAFCWWNLDEPGDEQWPWTPDNTQRNNLVLLSCTSTEDLKVVSSVRTEGNPMDCCFSILQPYQLLTVELPAGPQGFREGSWVDTCVYDCARERVHRLSVTRIPLPSHPVSCSRHPDETTILLGLSDSSLVLYDQRRGVSLLVSCPVPPTILAWHPAGAMVMVGGGQGELMCFDVGLAPVSMALIAEEVTSAAMLELAEHAGCCAGLDGLQWGTSLERGPEGTDILMLAFHGGPLAALRFRLGALSGGIIDHGVLLQQRLRCGQVTEALGILEAMDWSVMGDECYRALSSVTNHLLRMELNTEREAQLEAALAVFYAPPVPHSDVGILEYREPISKYARRFFHHLLRHQRLEKAFLLAVDLEDKDLFMDLHYVASDKGEVVLADVAKRKANEIEAQAVTGSEDTLRGKNGVFCGSSLEDRQTERNHNVTGPPCPGTPTTHNDGHANQMRLLDESVHVTMSPNMFRKQRHTGTSEHDRDSRNDNEDPGMLHVVHLGMV